MQKRVTRKNYTTMWTQTRINLGFLLVLAVVLANALVAYNAQQQLARATHVVTQTHETIVGTAELLEALLNAETGQRGYIITEAKQFLEPYLLSEQAVVPRLNKLATLLADDAESRALHTQLEPLVTGKLAELRATIKLADDGHLEAARSAILFRHGKNFMDQIRALLARIEQRQVALRQAGLAERDGLMRRALITLMLGTLLTSAVIGIAYYLNRRELEASAQNKANLEEANARLEARVEERTAQLKLANQELTRSNRELQDFAFVASHDLQEPLRKIQAFGDLLKQDYGGALGDEGCDFIERMQNASRRMERLIKDLLAYSRVTSQAQPFVPIDLNKIAQEALNDLEARIRQTGGQITVGELPIIEADALQMHQLLQNLIGNALKFNRPGVPPVITVEGTCPPVIEDEAVAAPRMCEITVADNGIGFDKKYLDRIFTPFQRLHGKNEYEGTGMGLAICRKVVERHGGSITARSQPDIGTTFLISLPFTHSQGAMTV